VISISKVAVTCGEEDRSFVVFDNGGTTSNVVKRRTGARYPQYKRREPVDATKDRVRRSKGDGGQPRGWAVGLKTNGSGSKRGKARPPLQVLIIEKRKGDQGMKGNEGYRAPPGDCRASLTRVNIRGWVAVNQKKR